MAECQVVEMSREVSVREGSSQTVARILTTLLFVLMLAGNYSLSRLGVEGSWSPVPERLAGSLVITVLVIVHYASRSRSGCVSLGPVPLFSIVFFAYMCLATTWAPPLADVSRDYVDFACMALQVLAASLLVRVAPKEVARTFLWCLLASGLLFALAGLVAGGGRASAFGGGPNVYGRVVGLGLIALLVLWQVGRIRTLWLGSGVFLLAAVVASGSRGAMLAFLAAIVVLVVRLRVTPRQKLGALATLVTAGFVVVRQFGDRLESVVDERIVKLTFGQGYDSGRDRLWEYALALFEDHQLAGAGTRAFETLYGNGFRYPHNLALQVAAEGGAIGLILFGAALLAGLGLWWQRRDDATATGFLCAGLVVLVASMFSGDYYDARFLWVFVVLIASGSSARVRDERHSKANLAAA